MADPGILSIIGSAVIGAISTTSAADTQARAARDVATEQGKAQELALAEQRRAREEALQITAPFRETGQQAFQQLYQQAQAPGLSSFAQTQLDESQKATNQVLASLGLIDSGAQIDVQSKLASQVASQDVYRKQNILSGLATTGAGLSGQAAGYAGTPVFGQPITSGITGQANAQSGAANQLAGLIGATGQAVQTQDLINKFFLNNSGSKPSNTTLPGPNTYGYLPNYNPYNGQ